MRFMVQREPLGDAVAWVARALPSRPVLPMLSGILLSARSGQLTVSCFDYEVAAQATIDAEVEEQGQALVPGRLLAEITRSLPGLPAWFAADGDAISLACGAAEFSLVCVPADGYPPRPELPPPAGTIDGAVLATAVAQVVPSASRDDTLAILTAVCLEADGGTLSLAATDRYRLAVREMRWEPARAGGRVTALVPARTLADAARAMSGGVPVTIGISMPGAGPGPDAAEQPAPPRPADGMISFAGGGKQLATRLIGGEFIRYRSRFPAEFGCVAEMPAAQLLEAVRRVALVADRATPVRLSFRPDQLVIEARAEGRARAAETVPASFTGDQPAISFEPHYLLDGLAAAAADDGASSQAGQSAPDPADGGKMPPGRIRLQFSSAAKPALITWAGAASPSAGDGDAIGHADPAQVDADHAAGPAQVDADGPADPAFRYLLVPLRTPARA